MQDRLTVWLSLAAAFVALVALVAVGLQPLALFGLVQVPAVLLVLLAGRAAVCLVRGESTALRVGPRQVLGGWPGLLVPLALLAAWTVGRERGIFSARLCRTAIEDQSNASWNRDSSKAGPGQLAGTVSMPAEFATAHGITIDGGDGAMHDRFVAELSPLAELLPDYRIVGRIELQTAPPFAALPLWKTAATAARVTCDLYLCETAGGACRAHLGGGVDITGSCTVLGFASRRDFHELLGSRFGTVVREPLIQQLRQLRDAMR